MLKDIFNIQTDPVKGIQHFREQRAQIYSDSNATRCFSPDQSFKLSLTMMAEVLGETIECRRLTLHDFEHDGIRGGLEHGHSFRVGQTYSTFTVQTKDLIANLEYKANNLISLNPKDTNEAYILIIKERCCFYFEKRENIESIDIINSPQTDGNIIFQNGIFLRKIHEIIKILSITVLVYYSNFKK